MSRTTQVPPRPPDGCRLRGSHPLRRAFPDPSANRHGVSFIGGPTTPDGALRRPRFGLLRVRSPLLAQSLLFSFPPGSEMFQFPGFASAIGGWHACARRVAPFGNPRIIRVFAPTHGLSQLVTSFVASESQGILHVPFSPFLIPKQSRLFRVRTLLGLRSVFCSSSFLICS